jgi:uncharacterized protein
LLSPRSKFPTWTDRAIATTLTLTAPLAAHCVGQPVLKPLQPLTVTTAKGRFNLMVEFADTERTREYGLMCRKRVAPDRGMLFDFKAPMSGVAFWMRNTVIPLDIVYIRPDGTVLSIAKNVPALDETPVPAGGTIRGVLELADRIGHRIFPRG